MSNPIPSDPRTINQKVLALLKSEPDRLHSYQSIATACGTTRGSVKVRLGQLRRLGAIVQVSKYLGTNGGCQYAVTE